MITIAGAVSDGSSNRLNALCHAALGGLRLFGGEAAITELEGACFGALRSRSSRVSSEAFSDGRLLCLADARIDNLEDLSRRLHIPIATGPAVALVNAWRKWGPGTPRQLIGEYAFALFDSEDRRLWLVRDPSGYRPLFFRSEGGATAFASMPSGLLALHAGSPDLARFARHVDGLPSQGAAGFWTDIRQVPAGAVASFDSGRRHERMIVSADVIDNCRQPWEELVAEMRQRLDRAVARNMVDAGDTLAAHLSSGLDSSAIAATAARMLRPGQSLLALTSAPAEGATLLIPRGRFPDEAPLASETAQMAGIEHIVVRERSRLLPAIRCVGRYFQQPAPAQFSFMWWRAMNDLVRSRGGAVVLTGGQGNGTLSYGGLGALARYLRAGRFSDWLREATQVRAREKVRLRGVLFNSVHPLVPDVLGDRLFRAANGIPQEIPSYVRAEWRQADNYGKARPSDYMAGRLAMIRDFDAGTRKRGMFALTGIEERDPAADRELMEFALSLPPEAHLKDGRIKPLIRDALSDRVPSTVLNNRQRGVSGADWYDRIDAADCRDAMDDIRASHSASELLDIPALDRAIADWPEFDATRVGPLAAFGRGIARALSTGLFLAETDRYPLGRTERQ